MNTTSDTVHDLDRLPLTFAERFNARDVEGLLALNAAGAVFVPAPGHPVTGEADVRTAIEQFLALELPITMAVRRTYRSDSTGFVVAEWSIEGAAPDGSPVSLAGVTADVARYSSDAGWQYVIDNPFGTA